MLSLSDLGVFVVLVLLAPLVIYTLIRKSSRPLNFPPGPRPIPFLGNLHQIPLRKSYLQFTEWSRTYGPIIGLHIGAQPVIILNSSSVVHDLLDQRGAVYNSRPDIPIVQYVVPGDLHLAFMKYDRTWRRARKTTTEFLTDAEIKKLLPIQDAESTQMLFEVMQKPQKYRDHVFRQFGAVILASVYGQRSKYYEKGKAQRFFTTQDEWATLLDASAMPPLDILPVLKYIPDYLTPWRGWKARAADLKEKQGGLYRELFQESKQRFAQGLNTDCFVAKLLKGQEKEGWEDLQLVYIASFMLEAGSDTTANGFLTFIVAMAAFPHLQQRAQAEIDSLFSETDMPDISMFDGGKKLPYVQACFWETLRWRPGLPTVLPHATTKDDVYNGYFIPAGTTVLMNTWSISHDPDSYSFPDTFDPDRFLANKFGLRADRDEEAAESDTVRRQSYAFGAGRRVCAGQRMAENSMLLAMAKIIWAFDIVAEEKLDTNLQTAWKDAILTAPKDMPITFRVRSEKRREVLEKEWQSADKFLERFE